MYSTQPIAKQKTSVYLGDLDRVIEALEHQRQVLRSQVVNQRISIQTDDYPELVNLSKLVASLKMLAEQVHADAEIATNLRRGERRSIAQRDIPEPMQLEGSSIIDTLQSNPQRYGYRWLGDWSITHP